PSAMWATASLRLEPPPLRTPFAPWAVYEALTRYFGMIPLLVAIAAPRISHSSGASEEGWWRLAEGTWRAPTIGRQRAGVPEPPVCRPPRALWRVRAFADAPAESALPPPC